jgi:RHS repeat-associated protein
MAHVGAIDGSFAVSGDGSACYAIPLRVPPGTGGMQPDLSLVYDSGSGNGISGVGWSLRGLSVITRCPATVVQDGFTGRVSYDQNDRFCLDGLRLVAVAGQYGASDAIYHTEIESWTRVVPVYGSNVAGRSGPDAFVVTTKDGRRHEYGTSPDSAPEADPGREPSIRVWALNRVVDRFGNAMTIDYLPDTALYPARIAYTSNAGAGLVAQRAVTFEYEPRPDTPLRYEAGYPVMMARRLKRVQTWVDGALVMTYALEYELGVATGRSRAVALTQSDASGAALPPTRFGWQDVVGQLYTTAGPLATPSVGWSGGGTFLPMDVNGDGHMDFVHAYPTNGGRGLGLSVFLAEADGSGFQAPHLVSVPSSLPFGGELLPMDVNGDGCCDLVYAVDVSGKLQLTTFVAASQGTLTANAPGAVSAVDWPHRLLPGDVNGDGSADLVCAYSQTVGNQDDLEMLVLLSDGVDFNPAGTPVNTGLPFAPGGPGQLIPVDFNGDGMIDLAYAYPGDDGRLTLNLLSSNGKTYGPPVPVAFAAGTAPDFHPGSVVLPCELNGDGLGDLVVGCPSADGTGGLALLALLSTGTTLAPQPVCDTGISAFGVADPPTILPLDANGDGLTDIVVASPQTSGYSLTLVLSTGSGFAPAGTQPPASMIPPTGTILPLDLGATGRTDLVYARPVTQGNQDMLSLAATRAVAGFPDLLATITDGLGGQTEVSYAPLTDPAIYTRGTPTPTSLEPLGAFNSAVSGATYRPGADANRGAVAGTRLVAFPRYLLARYARNDGRGHTYSYQHTYGGARLDLTGRGWLGFATTSATDESQGTISTGVNHQDFPLTRTPAETKLARSGDGALMQRVAWKYTQSKSAPYQVSPSDRRTELYTFGTLDVTQTTTLVYDEFGNVRSTTEANSSAASAARYTETVYANDSGKWRLGFPTEVKVTADAAQTELLEWTKLGYDLATMALITHGGWDNQAKSWQTVAFGYDAYGNQTSTTDVSGATSTVAYDDTFHAFPATLTSAPTPSGQRLVTTQRHEPAFGSLASLTDANGVTLSQTVDGLGRPQVNSGPDPTGATVQLTRRRWAVDQHGEIFTETSALIDWAGTHWRWTRSYLDGLGRVYRTATLGANGVTTVYVDRELDSRGQPLMMSLPYFDGATPLNSRFSYDPFGRPLAAVESGPGGQPVTTTYSYPTTDSTIRVEAAGTPRARRSEFRYGYYGGKRVLVESIDALGASARYRYDPVGRVTGTADCAATQAFAYDTLGRRIGLAVRAGATTLVSETIAYDIAARTVTRTLADGATIVTVSDALQRPLTKLITGAGTTSYLYDDPGHSDSQGRCSRVTLPDGTTYDYGYDAYGRQTEIALLLDGTVHTVRNEYTPGGNVARQTYPDGLVVAYARNAAGTVEGVGPDGAGAYATFSDFTARSMPQATAFGNGIKERRTLDAQGRPLTLEVSGAGNQSLLEKRYTYDELNLLRAIRDSASADETYDFDPVGRLKSSIGPYGSGSYTYDDAGNLTDKDGVAFALTGYQVTAGNRAGKTVLSATYDANGRMNSIERNGATTTYGYDTEGRLLKAGNTAFTYDHTGRRLKKIAADGTVTRYITPDYVVTTPPGGRPSATRYVSGIVVLAGAKTVYQHRNHLGSTVLQTGDAAAVVAKIGYMPWGEPYVVTGAPVGRNTFTGKELDSETGLYYFNARYYDPALGRFITPDDRIGGAASRHDPLNLYAYALNDPTGYIDPSGHDAWSAIGTWFSQDVTNWFNRNWQEVVQFAVDGALIIAGVAVLATTPFGGPASQVIGGALLGAGIGGLAYNITQEIAHQPISWKDWGIQVGVGAAIGAVGGGLSVGADAASSALGATRAGIQAAKVFGSVGTFVAKGVSGAIQGALIGGAGQLALTGVQALADHQRWDWQSQLGWNVLIGAATGGLAGVAGAGLENALKRTALYESEELVQMDRDANQMMAEILGRRNNVEVEFTVPLEDFEQRPLHPRTVGLINQVPDLLFSWALGTGLTAMPEAPNW